MGIASEHDLTLLLRAVRDGDGAARDQLFALSYDELRRIAGSIRYVGRAGDTMQPTALVSEAFVHFSAGLKESDSLGRAEFFRAVAMGMRMILRDHWRWKHRQRRDVGRVASIDAGGAEPPSPAGDADFDGLDLAALDEAMDGLERYNRRWHDVVMTRFYAARTVDETAATLGLAVTTVKSDWRLARGWLEREIAGRAG